MTNNISVHIDAANFYSTLKDLNLQIDYVALQEFIKEYHVEEMGQLNRCRFSYYTAIREDVDTGFNPLKPLLDYLEFHGWSVVKKPAKIFEQENTTVIKGNMDIEITVDALVASAWCDEVWLFTGDGDFTYLVTELQRRGKIVRIVSSIKTSTNYVAEEFRKAADSFVELAAIRGQIEKHNET